MMVNQLVYKPLAYLYFWWVKFFEKRLRFKVELNNLKSEWIDGTMVFDMTPVWKKHGINARGINYYTIGAVKDDLSSRYNPNSPYYQAWYGGYIVQFSKNRTWNVDDHYALGEADQKQWLEMYGDESPLALMEKNNSRLIKEVEISGYKGKLYEGGGWSHSDVGDGYKTFMLQILMGITAEVFNISNPKLDIKTNNFIPKRNSQMQVAPHHKVYLKGFIAIIELDSKTKAVLYINATIFEDKKNKKYDYFKQTKNSLMATILSTKILKI